jgi:hypothetical protein
MHWCGPPGEQFKCSDMAENLKKANDFFILFFSNTNEYLMSPFFPGSRLLIFSRSEHSFFEPRQNPYLCRQYDFPVSFHWILL